MCDYQSMTFAVHFVMLIVVAQCKLKKNPESSFKMLPRSTSLHLYFLNQTNDLDEFPAAPVFVGLLLLWHGLAGAHRGEHLSTRSKRHFPRAHPLSATLFSVDDRGRLRSKRPQPSPALVLA